MASSLTLPPHHYKEKLVVNPTRAPRKVTLLRMCNTLEEVKQLHAQFVVSGLLDHLVCTKRLLESYVTMSEICFALPIFERMSSPDVFAFNTMMRGLTTGGYPYDSLLLYIEFLLECLKPDNYTYTFVLKACSHLKALCEGKQVHCQIIKAGIEPDTHVHSSLIHMYTSSGCINDAERVFAEFSLENTLVTNSMISGHLGEGHVDKARAMFDSMAARDVASWSAMITGYTKNGMQTEALALFQDTINSRILPNESTLVSVLSACARLGALHQGRSIHAYMSKIGVKMCTTLGTALIDMYAKCGSIDSAYAFFQKIRQRDIVTWGAIISGFAIHGQARKCFKLFDEMLADGIHPNEVIFVAILSACSHGGYVEEGQYYFNKMTQTYRIRPSIEHYGCLVDLLGRAGWLAEAEELIVSMPEQPNSVIWATFLSACRTHNELRRGRWAFRHLIEVEPMAGDRYKLAGLMYANAGQNGAANKIRKLIKEKEMETTCGSSFIEIDGKLHEFIVGDIIHDEAKEIYWMWESVNRLLQNAKYVDGSYLVQMIPPSSKHF